VTVTQSSIRSPSKNLASATKQSPEASGRPRQSLGLVVVTTPVKRSPDEHPLNRMKEAAMVKMTKDLRKGPT
jgi:hypothetical protein